MKKFDLVIFDVDGTLLDTEELIHNTYEYTIKHHNLPFRSKEEIKAKPLRLHDNYKRLFPDVNLGLDEMLITHRNYFKQHLDLVAAFNNVVDTLRTLHDAGVKIAALSNRTAYTLYETLHITRIDGYFDKIIAADEIEKGKPDPLGVTVLIEEFKTTKEKTIIVGDSLVDIQTGQNAGITTIGVTYGWHGNELKNYKPDYLIHDIKDILPIILF